MKYAERTKAKELFGTAEEPSALASKVMGIKSRTFDVPSTAAGANGGKDYRVKLTEKEKERVKKLISQAKSMSEIQRLERELNEGRVPAGAAMDLDE